MYRVWVKQCEKPHNFSGRKRYRVWQCYELSPNRKNEFIFSHENIAACLPSTKRYRRGAFVNPTKIVKQYLEVKK
jgi:hypothetical protein